MDSVREYILSITAAAFLCAVLMGLTARDSAQGKLLKLVSGCFVALAVIAPLKNGMLRTVLPDLSGYRAEAERRVEEASEEATKAMKAIIKQQSEAYIQNKAAALDCHVSVSVQLDSKAPYGPVAVEIRGAVSPSAKSELSYWLQENFGLTGEVQTWRDS